MRARSDVDKIRSLMITHSSETDHYGEMMKAYLRTEKAKIPIADYTGITVRQWLSRRIGILKKLAAAVGPFPDHKVALKAKTGRKYDRGSYTVEGVSFYTRPDWPVSALLYLPAKRKGKVPGVLLVHGHSFIQKAAAVYQKVAVNLASNGYAVLAVDFVGGGERLPQGHENLYMYTAGMTVQGIMIWDNMRAIDYLSSRREVDSDSIGITGSSGGGNQTAFTTVFDTRIKASCPVNAVCMFDEHMAVGIDNFCPCEVIPGIWTVGEYSDLMATVAPRPLLLSQSSKDRLFPIKGVREVVNRAREVYRAYGVPQNIDISEDYSPHSYSSALRTAVTRWFDRHLKGIEPGAPEEYEEFVTIEDERSEVLCAFPKGKLPKNAKTLDDLFAEGSRKLPDVARPRTKAAYGPYRRKVLAHLSKLAAAPKDACPLEIEMHPAVNTTWSRLQPFNFQSEVGVTIPALLAEGIDTKPTRVVIMAHPDGKSPVVGLRSFEALLKGGAAVVGLDLRGSGETGGLRPGEAEDFTIHRSIMLGRHISFMRAFDISRAVDALRSLPGYERMPVYLWGQQDASMYALLAFALDRRIKGLVAQDLLLTFKSDAGFTQSRRIFPPNVLFGSDVADIIAASIDRRVMVANGELPDGSKCSIDKAGEVLDAALLAAKATRVSTFEVYSGNYEETESAVRRFLLEQCVE